jgi:transposase
MMARERFAEEFKAEAVRQVVERGFSVSDVANRLGVSAQSLYKWVRASEPSDEEKSKAELIEVKRENLRLRAELARAQEERDILKKAAAYFARQPE